MQTHKGEDLKCPGCLSSPGLFEVRAQEYLETLPSGEHSGVNKFLKGLGKAWIPVSGLRSPVSLSQEPSVTRAAGTRLTASLNLSLGPLVASLSSLPQSESSGNPVEEAGLGPDRE